MKKCPCPRCGRPMMIKIKSLRGVAICWQCELDDRLIAGRTGTEKPLPKTEPADADDPRR